MIEFFEEKYLTVYQVGLEEEAVFYVSREPPANTTFDQPLPVVPFLQAPLPPLSLHHLMSLQTPYHHLQYQTS